MKEAYIHNYQLIVRSTGTTFPAVLPQGGDSETLWHEFA